MTNMFLRRHSILTYSIRHLFYTISDPLNLTVSKALGHTFCSIRGTCKTNFSGTHWATPCLKPPCYISPLQPLDAGCGNEKAGTPIAQGSSYPCGRDREATHKNLLYYIMAGVRKLRQVKAGWGYGGDRKCFFGRVSCGAYLESWYLSRDLTTVKEGVMRTAWGWGWESFQAEVTENAGVWVRISLASLKQIRSCRGVSKGERTERPRGRNGFSKDLVQGLSSNLVLLKLVFSSSVSWLYFPSSGSMLMQASSSWCPDISTAPGILDSLERESPFSWSLSQTP